MDDTYFSLDFLIGGLLHPLLNSQKGLKINQVGHEIFAVSNRKIAQAVSEVIIAVIVLLAEWVFREGQDLVHPELTIALGAIAQPLADKALPILLESYLVWIHGVPVGEAAMTEAMGKTLATINQIIVEARDGALVTGFVIALKLNDTTASYQFELLVASERDCHWRVRLGVQSLEITVEVRGD